jgi:hypothetical protein
VLAVHVVYVVLRVRVALNENECDLQHAPLWRCADAL